MKMKNENESLIRPKTHMGLEQQLKDKIALFWSWFAAEQCDLSRLIDAGDEKSLDERVTPAVRGLHRELGWEVGPGKRRPYMLAITAEGNRQLKPLLRELLNTAPDLEEWEYYSLRPPRSLPAEIQIPGDNFIFTTASMCFLAKDNADTKRIDVAVIDEQFSKLSEKRALWVVFLVLDMLLGDDSVEEWIAGISVHSSAEAFGKALPIRRLPHIVMQAKRRSPRAQ